MLLCIYKINYFHLICIKTAFFDGFFLKFFRIFYKRTIFEFFHQCRIIWWIFVASISAMELKWISSVWYTDMISTSTLRIISRRIHMRVEIYTRIIQIDTRVNCKDAHIRSRWVGIRGLIGCPVVVATVACYIKSLLLQSELPNILRLNPFDRRNYRNCY